MSKPVISVIICTKNRPNLTIECLASLQLSSFRDFEIILVDQSTNEETYSLVMKLKDKRIRYFRHPPQGLGKARNYGIRQAKAPILAFTDSDCVVSRTWIKEINNCFKKNLDVVGVFGNVYPFKQQDHPGKYCPATFIGEKEVIVTDPAVEHWQVLGQGNNMSFRQSIFERVGYFRTWLGAGSLAPAAEDSELIFRILINKYKLMSCPKVVVYHNRWLSRKEDKLQSSFYTTGLIAFFTFYLFSKYRRYSLNFIKLNLSEVIIPKYVYFFSLVTELAKHMFFLLLEIFAIIRGLSVGIVVAISLLAINFKAKFLNFKNGH